MDNVTKMFMETVPSTASQFIKVLNEADCETVGERLIALGGATVIILCNTAASSGITIDEMVEEYTHMLEELKDNVNKEMFEPEAEENK